MTEQEAGVMAGRDHKPSNVGGLQKLGKKGKETDSLIDPSEGTDPANSLTLAKWNQWRLLASIDSKKINVLF